MTYFKNKHKTFIPSPLLAIRSLFAELIDREREAKLPRPVMQEDLAICEDVLAGEDSSQHTQVICRALYYMQLYPHLTAGEAMILGCNKILQEPV